MYDHIINSATNKEYIRQLQLVEGEQEAALKDVVDSMKEAGLVDEAKYLKFKLECQLGIDVVDKW